MVKWIKSIGEAVVKSGGIGNGKAIGAAAATFPVNASLVILRQQILLLRGKRFSHCISSGSEQFQFRRLGRQADEPRLQTGLAGNHSGLLYAPQGYGLCG